ERALEHMEQIAVSTATALGGSCQIEIDRGYPVVRNDERLCAEVRQAAVDYLGPDKVFDLPLVMWAEDFAYFGSHIPACFYNLGVANSEKGWTSPLHSPTMMVDEAALETGAGLLAWIALRDL